MQRQSEEYEKKLQFITQQKRGFFVANLKCRYSSNEKCKA